MSIRRFSIMIAAAAVAVSMAVPTAGPATADQAPAPACNAGTAPGAVRCLALYRSAHRTGITPATAPAGYGPAGLRQAYRLPGSGGAERTIAIVDAYDDPNAQADLAVYRKQYGLPECTTANGCFRKVNQRGETAPLPAPHTGWAIEISLDLDAVSAACPDCHLLLVEGDRPEMPDLGEAVDTAVRMGAAAVTNSYGADESGELIAQAARHYDHPGVPILASSGDDGFRAASVPAVLPTVIAVGGTSLTEDTTARGWTEHAWSGAGSGCSAWIAKPAWQHDEHCGMRTVSDVSAVADPATGLAVYDTYELGPDGGWLVVGGTSASAPLVAGIIGLAGHSARYRDASPLYARAKSLRDVVGGSNGFCGEDYLCTGVAGYDGPTGNGTPRGITAF
ncbi:S53 family peptidase [Amycolatopsis sp. CA-126428]|uniref:S53 family peptidase n=1 Tax=Amycolatopsis sp. CA-126428 TaxID=2073158 RepID=UPI001E44BDC1|nr:S8 family serine peptidase [Amycolatopsis sp. CA-126428]